MSASTSPADRFEDRLRLLLDEDAGAGAATGFPALETAMRENESCLGEYLDQLELDALLSWELRDGADSLPDLQIETRPIQAGNIVAMPVFRPLVAAAAVVLLLGAGFFLGRQQKSPSEISAPPSGAPAPAVAVLIDAEDCVWESGGAAPLAFGATFSAGEPLRIASGIARLALQSKAGVAISGPAQIDLISSEEVKVLYGNVSAFAPEEAIGFKLTTPGVEIVDLGTRFAASVARDGATDVHVFEGEISVQRRDSSPETESKGELVTTGQARRYSAGGKEHMEIALAPEHFADPPELEQLLAISGGESEESRLSEDPAMPDFPGIIAAQRFEDGSGNLDGKFGGRGFAQTPWFGSPGFTRYIPLVRSHSGDASAGGYLLVRGRDRAEPFVANRMRRELAEPLPPVFYFAVRASYHGLDGDDFFSLWIDSNGREDASHADAPTIGIREGHYFSRLDVDHAAVGRATMDGERFVIAGRFVAIPDQQSAEISLWVNPTENDLNSLPPDSVVEGPVKPGVLGGLRFLGVRVGQYTEVSDRLLIHGLSVGNSLSSVLEAAGN